MSRVLMTSNGGMSAVAAAGFLVLLGSIVGAIRLNRSDLKEYRP